VAGACGKESRKYVKILDSKTDRANSLDIIVDVTKILKWILKK